MFRHIRVIENNNLVKQWIALTIKFYFRMWAIHQSMMPIWSIPRKATLLNESTLNLAKQMYKTFEQSQTFDNCSRKLMFIKQFVSSSMVNLIKVKLNLQRNIETT